MAWPGHGYRCTKCTMSQLISQNGIWPRFQRAGDGRIAAGSRCNPLPTPTLLDPSTGRIVPARPDTMSTASSTIAWWLWPRAARAVGGARSLRERGRSRDQDTVVHRSEGANASGMLLDIHRRSPEAIRVRAGGQGQQQPDSLGTSSPRCRPTLPQTGSPLAREDSTNELEFPAARPAAETWRSWQPMGANGGRVGAGTNSRRRCVVTSTRRVADELCEWPTILPTAACRTSRLANTKRAAHRSLQTGLPAPVFFARRLHP